MTLSTAVNTNEILNRTAVEVGLAPVANPFADQAQHFQQMRYLLQTAGEELLMVHPWNWGIRSHSITTGGLGDSGDYPLPDDFLQMIDQTGWDRSRNVPLGGPVSAQDWTYLLGRNLASTTMYASFRLKEGAFSIFPQPPPPDINITFEYQSTNWASDGKTSPTYQDGVKTGSDVVLFDRTLITRYLKHKWLGAKGFDTTASMAEFQAVLMSLTGKDKGAPVLNAGRRSMGMNYLDAWRNAPDTGYGGI